MFHLIKFMIYTANVTLEPRIQQQVAALGLMTLYRLTPCTAYFCSTSWSSRSIAGIDLYISSNSLFDSGHFIIQKSSR